MDPAPNWLLCGLGLAVLLCGCPAEYPSLHPATPRDIEVVENPDNPLSCFVRWWTEEPATSRVEYGPDGEMRYVVHDDELVTEHELMLLALRSGVIHGIRASSMAEGDDAGRPMGATYTPENALFLPSLTDVTVRVDLDSQPGWTLATLIIGVTDKEVAAVIFDQAGGAVWYHVVGEGLARSDVAVSLVDGDRVLIGGGIPPLDPPLEVALDGTIVWEGPPQEEEPTAVGAMHHVFSKLPNGNYLTARYDFIDGLEDLVEEFDADGETVWSWNTADDPDAVGISYPHVNGAYVDLEDDAVFVSGRNSSRVHKVDRSSGKVLWTLGEEGDLTFVGDHELPWFVQQHSPSPTGTDSLLVLDNGLEERGYTRVLEYAVDPDEKTAEMIWEYPGELAEDEWFTPIWGNVERLDNGNTLITAASEPVDGKTSRIFEVTPDGTTVWEMWFPSHTGMPRVGAFEAHRIPVLVEEL